MPRYRVVWVELARAHYDSLPAAAHAQVDDRLEQLLENPHAPARGGYDPRTDSWTTTYGDGAGLLVYARVDERAMLIVLRLV